MHKCSNCGQEFEGKFCPECGEPWQDFKQCPSCGINLIGSVKFCPECGYAFTKMKTAAGQPQAAQSAKPKSAFKQKLSGIWSWIKSHLKTVVPSVAGLVVAVIMLSLIPTFIAAGSNGTYYGYYGGEYDKNSYITLKNYKWSDDEGESGKYKLSGKNIKIYANVFGETELFAQGTVKNGVLALDMDGDGKSDQIYVTKNHNHKYGNWQTDYEATCTSKGQETRYCACGVKERREIELKEHTLGEWEVTEKATCTEDGLEKRTCFCGYSETKIISAKGHSWSDWKYDKTSHWKACYSCSKKIDEGEHSVEDVCTVCLYESGSTVGLSYFNSANSYYIAGIGTATDTDIIIPSTYKGKAVISIGDKAFKNCGKITSVTIPDRVTSIGEYAFDGCSRLTNITIPDSVISIGEYAFDGCSRLTNITIPDRVTSIGMYAFNGCSSLESLIVSSGNAFYHSNGNCLIETESKTLVAGCKNSIIPNDGSITSIGGYAFGDCSRLTNITIPDSVTSIGEYAFGGCRSLTDIYYAGSKQDWEAIYIDSYGNGYLTNATIHYNYNG